MSYRSLDANILMNKKQLSKSDKYIIMKLEIETESINNQPNDTRILLIAIIMLISICANVCLMTLRFGNFAVMINVHSKSECYVT